MNQIIKFVEVQYQCTREDYLEAQAQQKKGLLFYLYWVIGVFFLLTGLVTVSTAGWSQATRMFLIAAASLAWPVVLRPLQMRRHFRTLPNFVLKQSLSPDEEGLHTTTSVGRSENKWSAYTSLDETPNLFLLYMGSGMFEVIPKRAFSASQLEEFRNLLTRHIPAR